MDLLPIPIILHTLRVEMIDGSVLLYRMDGRSKDWLEQYLAHRTDDLDTDLSGTFISFSAKPDRYVFIRIKDIARIIFCWDATQGPEGNPYRDNFQVVFKPDPAFQDQEEQDTEEEENEDEVMFIPPVIIKLKGVQKPLVFDSLDPETDCLFLDEESFEQPQFLQSGFINLEDEDGEENYIPVANISCMEVARPLIYPDEIWNSIVSAYKPAEN